MSSSARGSERLPVSISEPRCRISIGVFGSSLCIFLIAFAAVIRAESLDERVPALFPDLATSISPRGVGEPQVAPIPRALRELSAALATFRSQIPVPASSAAFRFVWNPEVGTFAVDHQSLGPTLAERAQTLGRHALTVSTSYSRIDFDTLDGKSLGHLRSSQPAFSSEFLATTSDEDQERFGDDLLETSLDFDLAVDQMFFVAAFGITQFIDVGIGLSLANVEMEADGEVRIRDVNGLGAGSFTADFLPQDRCSPIRQCAVDGFKDSAFGTGDVLLRAKWNFMDSSLADLAISGLLTIPTGRGDDLLGFQEPTFTPLLIASKTHGFWSPHINVGYAIRDGQDVSQALWLLGTDVLLYEWLTFSADFLGYHDDKRDGVNDDVIQSSVGLRVALLKSLILVTNLQFPVNRDGLRADVIPTGQLEYIF